MLPESFIKAVPEFPGIDPASFIEIHNQPVPVTSVRFNPIRTNDSHLFPEQELTPVPWASEGFYLSQRPSFITHPGWHAGAFYVQEASSMFLEQGFRTCFPNNEPIRVLDLCAAPGGKSTHLASLIPQGSLLASNEVIKARAGTLAENLTRWGTSASVVTQNDPEDFQRLPHFFDLIVVDAPCSGSGMFHKDPEAISEWSPEHVQLCRQRQQRILADALPTLKPGGWLIYSTCSYSVEENEWMVNWLCSNQGMQAHRIPVLPQWNIVESKAQNQIGYRFYPDRVSGEGFFMALLQKDYSNPTQLPRPKNRLLKLSRDATQQISNWIRPNIQPLLFQLGDRVIAFPENREEDLLHLQSALYIKKAGTSLGTLVRQELIPEHDLALSEWLHPEISSINLDYDDALNYLRKHDLRLNFSGKKGWTLMRWNQLPLGWAKILPNRMNNYFPKEWRILNK